MSFKTINSEEYKRLLKNKKKMFYMTFATPESLKKYRDNDDKINKKILHEEEINNQNKNLSEMFDKNLNKCFNEKTEKIENILNQPTNNISTDLIELDNKFDDSKFITDEDILSSFDKVFKDYKIVYTPSIKSKNIYVNYLLNKLNSNKNVPRDIFDHFNANLSNLKFKNKKIPVENIDGKLMVKGIETKKSGNGNIKIKDLDKGISRVRYSNNRKLSNKVLKDYYKFLNEWLML